MSDRAIEVLFTQGEYSDFGIVALLRVPSRAWVDEQWAAFVDDVLAHPDRDWASLQRDAFVPWLLARGATRMEQVTVHLGDYGIMESDRKELLHWSAE